MSEELHFSPSSIHCRKKALRSMISYVLRLRQLTDRRLPVSSFSLNIRAARLTLRRRRGLARRRRLGTHQYPVLQHAQDRTQLLADPRRQCTYRVVFPFEEIGNPASMTSTPSLSRALAIVSFCFVSERNIRRLLSVT